MDGLNAMREQYHRAREIRDYYQADFLRFQRAYYQSMIDEKLDALDKRGVRLGKTTVTRGTGDRQKYKVIDVVVSGDTEEAMYLLAPIVDGKVGPRQAAVRASEIFMETGAQTDDV